LALQANLTGKAWFKREQKRGRKALLWQGIKSCLKGGPRISGLRQNLPKLVDVEESDETAKGRKRAPFRNFQEWFSALAFWGLDIFARTPLKLAQESRRQWKHKSRFRG